MEQNIFHLQTMRLKYKDRPLTFGLVQQRQRIVVLVLDEEVLRLGQQTRVLGKQQLLQREGERGRRPLQRLCAVPRRKMCERDSR